MACCSSDALQRLYNFRFKETAMPTTIRLPKELRADFDALAEDRYARIVATGKTIPWQKMRGYLEERLACKKVKRPATRKLAR
jgi:hypothetical protein